VSGGWKRMRWPARPEVWAGALVLLGAVTGHATDLNLRVESRGQATVTVPPGAVVPYAVVGELSDALNDGLALFSFDLDFSGGPLSPALAPVSVPMTRFAAPAGINNPQGFGGVATNGRLVQVGGAQNTLNNTFGPYPVGEVATGVALPGQPVALVFGRLHAPQEPGQYTLTPSGLVANVIAQGASGDPVWKVQAAGPGTLVPLTVVVEAPRLAPVGGRREAKP
jgi:hypothetical protein